MDPLLSLLDMMRVTAVFLFGAIFLMMPSCGHDERRSLFTHETIEREQNGSHLTYHVPSSTHFALSQAYATVQSCTTSADL